MFTHPGLDGHGQLADAVDEVLEFGRDCRANLAHGVGPAAFGSLDGVGEGAELLFDASLQVGLVAHLVGDFLVAGQSLVHQGVDHLQGLGVVAEQLLHHTGALHTGELLQLFQLGEELVHAAELALAVCEVEVEASLHIGEGGVGLGEALLVHSGLEHFADCVACGLSGHAGLIHHHQQRC
ncbi:hypothetical protein D3C80_1391950 [compost metagenome]